MITFDVTSSEEDREDWISKSSSKFEKIQNIKEFVESRQKNFEEEMIKMSHKFLPIFEEHKRFLTRQNQNKVELKKPEIKIFEKV